MPQRRSPLLLPAGALVLMLLLSSFSFFSCPVVLPVSGASSSSPLLVSSAGYSLCGRPLLLDGVDVGAALTALTEQVAQLQLKAQQQQSRIDAQQATLLQQQGTIDAQQVALQHAQAVNDAQNATLVEQQSTISAQQALLSSLQARNVSLTAALEVATSAIAELQWTDVQQQTQLSTEAATNVAQQTQLDYEATRNTVQQEQIDELLTRNGTVGNNLGDFAVRIAQLRADVTEQQVQLNTEAAANGAQQVQIDALLAHNETVGAAVTNFAVQIAQLQQTDVQQQTQLTTDAATNAAQHTQLSGEVDQLRTQMQESQTQLAFQLQAANASLTTDLAELRARITAAEQLSPVNSSPLVEAVRGAEAALQLDGPSALVALVNESASLLSNLALQTPAYKNRVRNLRDDGTQAALAYLTSPTDVGENWSLFHSKEAFVLAGSLNGTHVGTLDLSLDALGLVVSPPPLCHSYMVLLLLADEGLDANDSHIVLAHRLPYGALADLSWGTPEAIPLTLSFYVRATHTGNYTVTLSNAASPLTSETNSGGAAAATTAVSRSCSMRFAVPDANVWHAVSITLPGDQDPQWRSMNGDAPVWLSFTLLAGSAWRGESSGSGGTPTWLATGVTDPDTAILAEPSDSNAFVVAADLFFLAGVQLERGTRATALDVRPYKTELVPRGALAALDQRFQERSTSLKNRVRNGDFSLSTLRSPSDEFAVGLFDQLSPVDLLDGWQLGGDLTTATLGRWRAGRNLAGVIPPMPQYFCLGLTNGEAVPAAAEASLYIQQTIPVARILDFRWSARFDGTDSSTIPELKHKLAGTLSWWVRSSVVGNYSVQIRCVDADFALTFTYDVTQADTWNKYSYTIGAHNAFQGDNLWRRGKYLAIQFHLQTGSASGLPTADLGQFHLGFTTGVKLGAAEQSQLGAVANSTFYLAAVQFERGSEATDFDLVQPETEAALVRAVVQQATPAYKNRVINGNFALDSINKGARVLLPTGTKALAVADGWRLYYSVGRYYVQQNMGAPNTTQAAVATHIGVEAYQAAEGSGYVFLVNQMPYGALRDLQWGTELASPTVLSFRVRSSIPGVFSGSLRSIDSPFVIPPRYFLFRYFVAVADEWQLVTVPIPGDTHAAWRALTDSSLVAITFTIRSTQYTRSVTALTGEWADGAFSAGSGTTDSLTGLTQVGATFMLSGVQLEAGSMRTAFDVRPFGTELMPLGTNATITALAQRP